MNGRSKRIGRVLINGILLVSILGLLLTYLVVVYNLPARIYTPAQREYLRYNADLRLEQAEPIWNVVQPDGQVIPTILPGQRSRVRATLAARYEEYAGVSATVYDLTFLGEYDLANSGLLTTTVQLVFPFPGNLETLHDVRFLVDDEEPAGVHYSKQGIQWQTVLSAGQELQITISYQATGASRFSYGLHHGQRADVDIVVTVSGLVGSEVPRTALRPSANEDGEGGETFAWAYNGLIADRDIQLNLPERLSFAQRVAQLQDDFRTLAMLAPVLVGSFLASLAGLFYLDGMRLRLEGYLLAGCGLALFYPLLTFLSGLVDVAAAAPLALLFVAGLLLAFVRRVAGRRQAWQTGLLLGIFLGACSLGMLTPWRGLFLTTGGLLLVGAFMLLYARRPAAAATLRPTHGSIGSGWGSPTAPGEAYPDWLEASGTGPEPGQEDGGGIEAPATGPGLGQEDAGEVEWPATGEPEPVPGPEVEPAPGPHPAEVAPETPVRHCPYCARALADDDNYCSGCGHDTGPLHRCAECGREQFVPAELRPAYCLHCGGTLN